MEETIDFLKNSNVKYMATDARVHHVENQEGICDLMKSNTVQEHKK